MNFFEETAATLTKRLFKGNKTIEYKKFKIFDSKYQENESIYKRT